MTTPPSSTKDHPTPLPKNLHIRAARLTDIDTLIQFTQCLAQDTEDKALDPQILRQSITAALRQPLLARYYVVEQQGKIIGQAMITTEWSDWRNGHFWWLQSVYIHQTARRQGVFAALFAHIRHEARQKSEVCGLRLYVDNDNHNAIATYRALNMQRCHYTIYEEDWSDSAL